VEAGQGFLASTLEPCIACARLGSVAPDRFDRATFLRLIAKRFFLGRFGLLVNVGMAAVVVPFEIGWGGLAAKIAIDTLVVDVEFPLDVLRIFVCDIGHRESFAGLGPEN
jgi:hypothetical protein